MKPGLMVHVCNPSTSKSRGRRIKVPGQPCLYREFEASLGYMRQYLRNENKNDAQHCSEGALKDGQNKASRNQERTCGPVEHSGKDVGYGLLGMGHSYQN